MNARHHQRPVLIATTALALSSFVGCQIREPFEVTVVAAGVDGAKIKTGIFEKNQAYATAEDGSVSSTHFEPAYERGGRILGPDVTWLDETVPRTYDMEPLQDASSPTGAVTINLLDPAPEASTELFIASWYDANDDGKLTISLDGPSESARTIWYWDEDEETKVYLWAYNYNENGTDPYYSATALGATNGTNYILDDGAVRNQAWMALITGVSDELLVPEDPFADDGFDDDELADDGTADDDENP